MHNTEGVMRKLSNGTWQQEYFLKDHLGNTRVTFTDADNNGAVSKTDIKQENHYYPFGLNMEGSWSGAAGANKYQYNGKEWNDDFGLGWFDYGARFYDPAVGRWSVIDPIAEKFIRHNPYNYVMNRPMNMIDPNGMESEAYGSSYNGSKKGQEMYDKLKTAGEERAANYDNSTVKLYYTNATGGTNNTLTTTEVVNIVAAAGKIMHRNGIDKNLSFKSISLKNAKEYSMTDKNAGFVALISHPIKPYGLSDRIGDSRIGRYDKTSKDFLSYVNYGRIKDEKNNFPDAIYSAGFSMAHEFLHQLLYFASSHLDNDPKKFSHENSKPNLNMDGQLVKYPLIEGSDYEIITPEQKAYLKRFFGN